jgi:5-methylcytosine-specific restriction endonuclease McrA
MMTWVKPPGSNRSKQLAETPELEADFRDWLARQCRHSEFQVVRVHWSDGRPAYRQQCVTCGLPDGSWIGKDKLGDLATISEGDADQHTKHEDARRSEWNVVALRHYQQQNSTGKLAYDQYLKSPEWRAKSKKVIQRAGGICEGCLERKATQAHHVSYRHIFDEFLWELRAICEPCHERAHVDDGKIVFGDDGSMWEQPDDELDEEADFE